MKYFYKNVSGVENFCIFAAEKGNLRTTAGRQCFFRLFIATTPPIAFSNTNKRDGQIQRDGIMTKQDKAFREACRTFFEDNWDKPLEKEKKKRKTEKFDFSKALVEAGVNEEVARDWMAVRKQKKAANTRTAFNLLLGQLEIIRNKYKVTNNDIIMVCVCRCWMGCRASFFDNINFADYGIETAVQNNNLPNINKNIPNYGRTRHQEAFVRTFSEEDQQNQIF